jgi:hypothetical protein
MVVVLAKCGAVVQEALKVWRAFARCVTMHPVCVKCACDSIAKLIGTSYKECCWLNDYCE